MPWQNYAWLNSLHFATNSFTILLSGHPEFNARVDASLATNFVFKPTRAFMSMPDKHFLPFFTYNAETKYPKNSPLSLYQVNGLVEGAPSSLPTIICDRSNLWCRLSEQIRQTSRANETTLANFDAYLCGHGCDDVDQ